MLGRAHVEDESAEGVIGECVQLACHLGRGTEALLSWRSVQTCPRLRDTARCVVRREDNVIGTEEVEEVR